MVLHPGQKCPNIPCYKDKRGSPRLTILPKTAGLWVVGQFQRRLRNCHLHSFMAACSPAAMACRMPGFCRISRRWRRLSRARLGSRTNCTFLELVRRLDEEATLTIPLVQQTDKGNEGQAANIPPYDGLCDCLALCAFLPLKVQTRFCVSRAWRTAVDQSVVNKHKPTDKDDQFRLEHPTFRSIMIIRHLCSITMWNVFETHLSCTIKI